MQLALVNVAQQLAPYCHRKDLTLGKLSVIIPLGLSTPLEGTFYHLPCIAFPTYFSSELASILLQIMIFI